MSAPSEQARAEAREILAERRFHETELPRPLRGPLEWLGDRLRPLADAVDAVLPGGRFVGWLVLATLVLVVAFALAARLVRDRAPGGVGGRGRASGERAGDPSELERLADEAEGAGDLESALRLRFRAGILRLAEREIVAHPGSVTSGELVRRLRSEPFARAASAFDEVVYGRRRPTAEDVRLAREGWRAALSGARA